MKSFIASNLKRRGQLLFAVVLATLGLVWLLGMWSGLQVVEARGPTTVKTGSADPIPSNSETVNHYLYLPMLSKSDLVFFDDFSDSKSGWPTGKVYGEECYLEYREGRYRVRVTANRQSCIMPNFRIPRQFNGTFKVKVRRISDEEAKLFYGFIFDAAPDATDETGTRWSLEVYPNKDPDCDNKPFFWLVALKEGDREDFHDECTSTVEPNKDKWNELKVIRNGRVVKVYVNGYLRGNYNSVPRLASDEEAKYGYFLLRVASASDEDIYVEFDDLEIWRSTTAP